MVHTEKIRLLRVVKNQSQTDLAACIHTTQTTYGKLETGKTPFSTHHCQRLAKAHGVCEKWLQEDEAFSLLIKVDAKGNTTIVIDPQLPPTQPANDIVSLLTTIDSKLIWLVENVSAKKRKTVRQRTKPRKGYKTKK